MTERVLLTIVLWGVVGGVTHGEAGQAGAPSSLNPSAVSGETGPYLHLGLFGITRPAGVANHRLSPPISGSALGAAVGVGVLLSRDLAIEGEVAWRGTVATPQRFSYNWRLDYTGEVRDRSFGAMVRWRPGGVRYVELMGGSGLVVSTVTMRDIVRTDYPPFAGTERQGTAEDTSYEPMLNGGIATPIRVAGKFAIVPTFAVRWVAWPDDSDERYSGVGSFVYQFGVGARFGF